MVQIMQCILVLTGVCNAVDISTEEIYVVRNSKT